VSAAGQLVRVAEQDRPRVAITIDGVAAEALAGDTVLTALLVNGRRLRDSDFGDGPRAGLCLMGACQDCWVWSATGERLRACTTYVTAGLAIRTRPEAP
jgi:predicted molibdopterin-dependent oxidoreductase YjgC